MIQFRDTSMQCKQTRNLKRPWRALFHQKYYKFFNFKEVNIIQKNTMYDLWDFITSKAME